MSTATPLHKEVQTFVKAHLGKDAFAPFTGQDSPAWIAFVYALQCYSHGGGVDALVAMGAIVRCAQPLERVLRIFVQAIPAVLDWGDVARLWPRIGGEVALRGDRVNATAVEICAHELYMIPGCPTPQVRLHGWRPLRSASSSVASSSARLTRGEDLPGCATCVGAELTKEIEMARSLGFLHAPGDPPCSGCPNILCSDHELCARKRAP